MLSKCGFCVIIRLVIKDAAMNSLLHANRNYPNLCALPLELPERSFQGYRRLPVEYQQLVRNGTYCEVQQEMEGLLEVNGVDPNGWSKRVYSLIRWLHRRLVKTLKGFIHNVVQWGWDSYLPTGEFIGVEAAKQLPMVSEVRKPSLVVEGEFISHTVYNSLYQLENFKREVDRTNLEMYEAYDDPDLDITMFQEPKDSRVWYDRELRMFQQFRGVVAALGDALNPWLKRLQTRCTPVITESQDDEDDEYSSLDDEETEE